MKILATKKKDQNDAVLDPWTVVHFSIGLALGLMNAPLRGSLAAAAAYELVEQFFERHDAGQELFDTSGPEVIPNAIVDLAVLVAGHKLGKMWNDTA